MPSSPAPSITTSGQPAAPGAAKVLLVAWESCDWDLLTPLIEADQLPAVAGLLERGVAADLHSLDTAEPALLWTSLATGLRPERHGVLDRVAPDPASGELRPAGLVDSRQPSLWRLLSAAGVACHAVNWFGSHPAELLSGVAVSDRFRQITGPLPSGWPPAEGSVQPVDRLEALACRRCHPSVLSSEDLAPYIRDLGSINLEEDRRPIEIATLLAETASVNAAARWLLENEPCRFLAVRFHAIGAICQRLRRVAGLSDSEQHHFGDLLPSALRLHDRMLAGLIELAGEDATVMLVSEQGAITADPWRRQNGLLAMAGPGIAAELLLERAHLLDVVPTVLRVFGLAAIEAMAGTALEQTLLNPPLSTSLTALPVPDDDADDHGSGLGEHQAVAQMQALGLPLFSPHEQLLQTGHRQRSALNRALLLIEAGDWNAAVPVLAPLTEEVEAPPGLRLLHAYGLLHCGNLAEAARVTAAARQQLGSVMLVLLLEALLAMAHQDLIEALRRLEEAERLEESDAFATGRLGLAWLQLGRLDRAEHHLRCSLERNAADSPLRLVLAAVLLERRQPVKALQEAQKVLMQIDHSTDAHMVMGHALRACDQVDAAREAYHRALARAVEPTQRAQIEALLATTNPQP